MRMQKLGPVGLRIRGDRLQGLSAVLGLASVLVAGAAAANTTGQYGFTGRSGSCLECHGSTQYPGLSMTVDGLGETVPCWVQDEEQSTPDEVVLKLLELPTIDFNQTVNVTVAITEPTGATVPECPTSDCCAPNPVEGICANSEGFYVDNIYYEEGECVAFLNVCDQYVAGFNMEVLGGGAFAKVDATDTTWQFRQNGGVDIPTEVTHVQPAFFNGGADITWNLTYTAPAEADYDDALQFWVGANVANGNGRADELDLNSNYQLTVAVADKMPSFCAVCDDGSQPDDQGNCGGCACIAPGDTVPVSAGVFALGFMILFRRRRR